MLRMHTWQLIVVTAVTVASVGYMAYTIARPLSRTEVDRAEVRPSTPLREQAHRGHARTW